MIRKIIIPTWEGHFLNAFSLVKSYKKNVLDKEKVTLCFITSDHEETKKLKNIVGCEYEIVDLLTLIKKNNTNNIDNLFKETAIISGKHPYQAIKKIFALKEIVYDEALLMDCEANFIKKQYLNNIFDDYFTNPFVYYSNITDSLKQINNSSIKIIDPELKYIKEDINHWCFEYHGWFIKKNIYNNFIDHIQNVWQKDILNVIKYPPMEFFEIISYYWYIKNIAKINYNFISIENSIKNNMVNDQVFLNKFSTRHCGIIEFIMRALDKETYSDIKNFISNNKLKFARIENSFDLNLVNKIINETEISIIACSQDYTINLGV